MFDNCWTQNNFLTAMFSGVWKPNLDNDSKYFIDRDGEHFGHILNYLRDHNYAFVIKSLDIKILKLLFVEAEFYRIVELSDILKKSLYVGRDRINKKIKVFWEKDQKWYEGIIKKYTEYDDKYYIKYDDGDEKYCDLKSRKWEFI